jgi:dolichyl-phosphate beta-glucosyltransferase
MNKLNLSIVIPAYNEEDKIEIDVREAFAYLRSKKMKGEVIVSTDGVTDRTNEIVKNLQKKFNNLHLIAYKKKIGKGGAIKKGVMMARGKYVMFSDAGYCVPFSYIDDGIKKLEEGYDCALASRASKTSKIKRKQPLYRRLGSKLFGLIVRNIIGVPKNIKDTQCGFKIYRNKVAKKLFSNLKTKSFMADIEIILRAKKNNYKMEQFPVEWKNDSDTKFNPISGSFINIKDLFKIKIKYKL